MKYYIYLHNNELNGAGQAPQLTEGVENLEVSEYVYNAYVDAPDKYIYSEGEIIDNPNYEAEQAQKERERLDMLILTPSDVERALYSAKGYDFTDLQAFIAQQLPEIDTKGLAIEFRASNFFRGATLKDGTRLFDVIGALLGYTPGDMDYLFVNKSLPVVEAPVPEPTTEETSDTEPVTDEDEEE